MIGLVCDRGLCIHPFSGALKSNSVTYGDEYIFLFREMTVNYLRYDRDYRLIGHSLYRVSFSFTFNPWNF